MKFILIDRIKTIEPPGRITAVKTLSLAEEYLADHFPTFPVMPGVLMLEAMLQTAGWLVRVTQDFRYSMIVLEEAKNITYKSFVAPGGSMEVIAEAVEIGETSSDFKAMGRRGDEEIVKARLKLRHYNLADRDPQWADTDDRLIADARKRFDLLGGPAALKTAGVLAHVR